jgi:poly-gamma-glutamate capsule biosynthesis protein CapA/YwtB (metallophosphatase superfamily)
LDALGYRETTGYQDMRVIAKKALESAGLKWSGDKLPTDADKAKAAALKKSKVEMDALLTVQKENPFGMVVGESLQDWNARTFSIAQETMQEAVDEKLTKQTTDTFNSLIKTLDENQLFVLTKMLIEHSPFDLAVLAGSEEGVEEEATA